MFLTGLAAVTLPVGGAAHNWGAADSTPPPGVSTILCTKFDPEDDEEYAYINSECTVDNSLQHYVWIDPNIPSGEFSLLTALQNSISQDFDSIDGVYSAEVSTISSSNRVRIFYDNFDPSLPRAFTFCDETATTGLNNIRYHMWCKPHIIIYQDNSYANNCWSNGACRKWLACHELGHTLGLQHSTTETTCMTTSAQTDVLNAHDIGHLEDCYPHPTLPLPTYGAETRSSSCKFP